MGSLGQYNVHNLDIIDWNACTKPNYGAVMYGNGEKNQKIPQYHNICVSIGVWTSIGNLFFLIIQSGIIWMSTRKGN